jgi:CDP-paratose 2-epimerase
MKIFITGICGFVGSSVAAWLRQRDPNVQVAGLDNFCRPGSETNRLRLRALGVSVRHGDVRIASDFESLPAVDWVVDAAANPSVLAGVDGTTSSRQLLEHNLQGTINILEYCKRAQAGFVLLSTSRVYSIRALSALPLVVRDHVFRLDDNSPLPAGVSRHGIDVDFATSAPLSLYGSSKLASETLALEYSEAFSFPVWVNRCGVLAGAGQFGTAEQGIFSYWVHAYAGKRPLKYIGFDGSGHQVRDAFHPDDLAELVFRQMNCADRIENRIFNAGGGPQNAMSLAQLSAWCADQFGQRDIAADPTNRPFDVAWVVIDNRRAATQFNWVPKRALTSILEEIAGHAERNPHWLEITGGA